MKKVAELKIYKTAYIFIREAYKIRAKMNRSLKYEIGQELTKSALNVIKYIVIASRQSDKEKILRELLNECELLWTWLRLAWDLKGMSSGEFRVLSELLDDLSKQAAGWAKWSKKNN